VKLRWALRFVLFVAGLVGAITLVLRTEWAGQELCRRGVALARGLSGQRVTVDHCAIDPVAARVEIRGLRVGPEAGPPLFAARRVMAELAPLQAFGARLVLSRLEVDSPEATVDASPGDEPSTPAEPGCLSMARHVRVNDLVIREGRADVTLGGGRLISARDVRLEGTRRGNVYALGLDVGGGGYEDPRLHVPLESLSAHVRLDVVKELAHVDGLSLSAAGSGLSVSGLVRELCRPRPDLTVALRTQLGGLAALLPGGPDLRGEAALDVRITGDAAHPQASGRLRLTGFGINDMDPGDMTLPFRASASQVDLEGVEWPIEKGMARVTAHLKLDERLHLSVDASTEDLEFQRLMARLPVKGTPVMMQVTSRHHLEGTLLGGFLLEGHSEVDIADFRVRTRPWYDPSGEVVVGTPRARVETAVRIDAVGVHLPDARIRIGGDRAVIEAQALLAFREARGMSIRATVPELDLELAGNHVANVPVGGVANIEAVIEGPYSHPVIEGDVRLSRGTLFAADLGEVHAHVFSDPSLEVLDFQKVGGRRGETDYEGAVKLLLQRTSQIEARLEVKRGGRLSDVFQATSGLLPPLAWLAGAVDGRVVTATAHLEGPLLHASGGATLGAADAHFLERPFDLLNVDVRLENMQRLVFERTEAIRSGGRLLASGEIDLRQAPAGIAATLDAEGLPVRDLLGEFGTFADLGGQVAAHGTLGGTTEALQVRGNLEGSALSVHGIALPEARLTLVPGDGTVEVSGPVCGAGDLTATVHLAAGLPYEAGFALAAQDVSRYLPPRYRVGGDVRGRLGSRGTLADITASSGTVFLDRLALSLGDDYRVASQGEVRGSFDGGSFAVQQLRLSGENTSLQIAGERSRQGLLDLQAEGTFDARLLDTLVPQIDGATGQVEIKAAITGTGSAPVLVGSAEVRRAGFHVKPLPITVRGLGAQLAFSQNQVIVEDATMTTNGGTMRVRGTVALRDWAPTTLDLSAEGRRVSWQKPAEWPAILSGNLQLGGSWPASLVLTGRLNVDRLRYTKDVELERAALDFSRRVQLLTAGDEAEWIRLNVDLVGGQDMRVDNNLVRARLQFVAPPGASAGSLQLVGSNTRIGLLGSVEILESVAFFRGNEYRIQHGLVSFDERDQIDPQFDITAETAVRDYRVNVHALGRLGDGSGKLPYTLTLSSDPALAQADIVTLLTFGFTSVDLDRGGNAAAGAGVAAEALLAVSGLEEHVRRFLPEGKLIQDPDISLTSQYSRSTGQLEPMAVFEARLITDKLRLKAAAPIASVRGRSAAAEYRFSDSLSTRLIWEDQETVSTAGDLGLDLKLRWEWE
jgi:translocation and assembly module TamB